MKKFNKIIAVILTVVITISAFPLAGFAADEDTVLEMADEYLGVTLSGKNGGFLISTREGDKLNKADNDKNLLYPSEDYDTSFTSFRITRDNGDVEEYIFGGDYGFLGLNSTDVNISREGNTLIAVWGVKDLSIEQRISLLDETSTQHGMSQISYSVTSSKDDVANVKVRVLLDTALGKQDYAFYQLSNSLGEYRTVRSEVLLNNEHNMAYDTTLFAVDDAMSPSVNAYTVNTTVDGKSFAPYQVAFGHWNNLASSVFDFAPDTTLDFTTPYNAQYRTADSAYALYFDMGALTKDTASTISTHYGIFSNANVGIEEKVAINLPVVPVSMEMNEASDAYLPLVENGRPGDAEVKMLIENISGEELDKMTVVVNTKLGNTPYSDWYTNQMLEEADTVTRSYTEVLAGEEISLNLFYNLAPRVGSEYRKFEILCYEAGENETLTEEKLLGSREFMVFCPGELGENVYFNSMDPQIIYYEGFRSLFITGLNFSMLEDTSAYTVALNSIDSGASYSIPAKNVVVNPGAETITLNVEEEMLTGTYQVTFDWHDAGKEDITSTLLQFVVSNDYTYFSPVYGILTVERTERYGKEYKIGLYSDENDYKKNMKDANNLVLLEFRGSFGAKRDANGNVVEATAKAIEEVDGTITSTITINNCIDIEDGYVTVRAVNAGASNQIIETDIEGRLYTSSSRSKIWDGVCAITSIKNGKECVLAQYHFEGNRATDVANTTANKDVVTLLWPGAASVGQTIAGVIFEFRYCEFGQIALEDVSQITADTKRERVIAFGAKLAPDFLIPSNFDFKRANTSPLEAVQLTLAKSNYLPHQLREAQDNYKADQEKWEIAQKGSLNLYVKDVLFGAGGFVGFNISVDVGIPDYAMGLPEIKGSLNLSIMPRNKQWAVGVKGAANFIYLEMKASLELKSYNGIPVPNQFFVAVDGGHTGVNIDGVGVLWVKGLGGGMDNIYDTMFSYSTLPPLALLLYGSFSLFFVFQADANLSASLRGFDVSLDNIGLGVKRLNLIDHLGLSAYWYPEFKFGADIDVDILSIIVGHGYIAAQNDLRNNETFWEAFVKATLQTPEIPLIGSIELSDISLGLNNERVWGAFSVIGIDMGVTYYWGGDVDFGFGTYDTPEPTIPIAFANIPIAESNGEILYMSYGANMSLAATTDSAEEVNSGEIKIVSTADRMTHKLHLGEYKSYQDLALTISFPADSLEEAERLAKGDKYGKNGINITAVDNNGKTISYPLNWLDNSVDAGSQTDKNALLSYNSEKKEANVTISFTEEWAYDFAWTLNTSVDSQVSIYEVLDMANLDSVEYSYNQADGMTATWHGEQLAMYDGISIYAVSENDEYTPLYETDFVAKTTDYGTATFELPAELRSGTYEIVAVASSEENSLHNTVSAPNKFVYVNPNQPDAPSIGEAKLGGDYTVDIPVANASKYDGFITTVYEQTADGLVETEFAGMQTEAEASMLTVGGSYETSYYADADGNYVSPYDAQGRDDVTEIKKTISLEAGKKYCVGISGYVEGDDGQYYASEEVITSAVTMTAPKKATITIAAQGAKKLADASGQTETIDVVGINNVVIDITSDMPVSGKWTLDSDAQTGTWSAENNGTITLSSLDEGEHTLRISGVNKNGDGVNEYYRFRVDATPPKLMISSPSNGGFFEATTTVSGITDAGASVVVLVDGVEYKTVTADADGGFSVDVTMDTNVLEHKVSLYAKDQIGNTSKEKTLKLNNGLVLGNPDTRMAIFIDGVDYTDKVIPAGKTGQLELRFVCGDMSIPVPVNSVIGGQAEWDTVTENGVAIISGQTLSTSVDVNGILTVQLDRQQAAAVLGGNRNLTSDLLTIKLPESPVGYEIKTDNSTTVEYGSSFSFTVEIKEGYSADNIQVTANGEVINAVDGVYTITDIHNNKTVEVSGVTDITPPEVTISVADKVWKEFLNTITFGLFFDETQEATVSATDVGSGVDKTYYYVSDEALDIDTVSTLEDWTEYTKAIPLERGKQYVIYAKAVDLAGNVTFVSSDGIVINKLTPEYTAPEDLEAVYGETLADVTLPEGFTWQDDTSTKVGNAGENEFMVTYTPDDTDNYATVENITVTVKVTGRSVTVSAENAEKTFGEADPELKYSIDASTPLLENDVLTGNVARTEGENVGVYEIAQGTLDNPNYVITFNNAYFKINPDTSGIDHLTVDNVTTSDSDAVIKVKNMMDNARDELADDATKAEWKAISDKCDALLDKILSLANDLEKVLISLDVYDESNVKSSDKTAIENIKAEINALEESGKYSDSEKAKLKEAEEKADRLLKKIEEVSAEIKRIEDVAADYSEDTTDESDIPAIEKLISDIEALTGSNNLTDDERASLENIKKQLNELISILTTVEYTLTIREPSRTTIRCRDTIHLHAITSDNLPEGATIVWTVDNDNFKTYDENDGKSFKLLSKNKGYTTVVATLYDADGNILASDSIQMYSRAGFFDKIAGFIRYIFGSTIEYEF